MKDQLVPQEGVVNFCLDKKVELDNETLVSQYHKYKELIKLVALCAGFCYLIRRETVDLETAINIFNAEHYQADVLNWIEEEQSGKRESGA